MLEKTVSIVLILAISILWYAVGPLTVLAAGVSALQDSYTTAEDVSLHVAGPSVLANDTGDYPLSIEVVGTSAHGTLTFYKDNSLDYAPNPNFNGTDSFSYIAGDGTSTSSPVFAKVRTSSSSTPSVCTSAARSARTGKVSPPW